jgi:dihydropteroate synthase/2-amino-4-hydroxy-6-hydroxymethyldihydropteridine diphosphokinase
LTSFWNPRRIRGKTIRNFIHPLYHECLLGLGSNVGNRQRNLQNAISQLAELLQILALSPIYETEPWGMTEQPQFLNMCLRGETTLGPVELVRRFKQIEANMGRQHRERWGPREIDIDLLFYDDLVLDEAGITVPHPRIAERAFVVVPLNDIVPHFPHPLLEKDVSQLLDETDISTVNRTELSPLPLNAPASMRRLRKTIRWGARTYLMGILNVTSDSFSGDGLVAGEDWVNSAVAQAVRYVDDGADILDLGGESTRPGSQPVKADVELERVLPVIKKVREALPLTIISIDTYRASTADSALQAGADWVNDVWGLRMDPNLAQVVAGWGCPVVLMHNRSKPKDAVQEEKLGGRYVGVQYANLMQDVKQELMDSVAIANRSGIADEDIILDPGIGFGKTVSQNLTILNRLGEIKALGYPVLLGSSRKSFIGYTLKLPVEERMEGTAATIAIGIDRGADIIRVHDVRAISRVARMTDRIVRVADRNGGI